MFVLLIRLFNRCFLVIKTNTYLFWTTTNMCNISFALIVYTTASRVAVLLALVATHATRV